MNEVERETPDDIRLALAIAIVKARGRPSGADLGKQELHWKKKDGTQDASTTFVQSRSKQGHGIINVQAKLLKQELIAVRHELQEIEEDGTLDKLPALAPCDCLFLNLGVHEIRGRNEDSDKQISRLSVQRFLSNVSILSRAKWKKRKTGNVGPLTKDHRGNLIMVMKFIMDLLSDHHIASKSEHICSYMHQSVQFVKDALPLLLGRGDTESELKLLVNKLTASLCMKVLNFTSCEAGTGSAENDTRLWSRQIILHLGEVPYLGQRLLLSISRLIAAVSETLVYLDPFHDGAAQTYDNLYLMLELFERLISNNMCAWTKSERFDVECLDECLEYHFQTVKFLEGFGNWSSLVVIYNNRITGEIITQLNTIVSRCHKSEGSRNKALLHLVELATAAIPSS